jgi:2-polyprenyl-3-methyl-5-hydroxy-6-metoxy-1,4-benzoquinol methylase
VDVGAGAGLRAQAAADLGYRVTAVEPDPGEAARAGGRPGIARVVARALDEARDRVGPADAVLAWHVLEHLPDLDAGVADLAAPLREGGVLVIGVPNAGGLEARALRGRWHGWEPARHRWHLTGAALGAVLGASGLEVLRLGPSGGWRYPSSLAYSLAPGLDPQRDPGRGPLGAALAAALVPLALLERAAGAGPQLVAVARRR